MPTKYRTTARWPKAKIEEIEIVRETEFCVFLPMPPTKLNPKGESRELKDSYYEYYDTWESAHAALTDKAARQLAHVRRDLELANSFAGNVKGMRRDVEFGQEN